MITLSVAERQHFCAEIIPHPTASVNGGNTYFVRKILGYSRTMRPTNEHYQEAVRSAWAKLRAMDARVGACPRVEWSKRMTRCAGLAFVEKGFIRLSSPLWIQYPEGFILEIIPHELAHMAAFRAFQDCGHGPGWKYAMLTGLGIPAHRLWCELRMLDHRSNWRKLQESKLMVETVE